MRLDFLLGLTMLGGACAGNATLHAPEVVGSCAHALFSVPPSLRLSSFNVKSGLESSLDAVAEELERIGADVVALQEVDVGVDRTNSVDQPQALADRLGMQAVFAATIDRGGGAYGIALLTRLPVQSVERVALNAFGAFEPRAAIDATLCVGASPLRFVAVHADFVNPGKNIETLAQRLGDAVGTGVVVAGDLNVQPDDEPPRRLRSLGLKDLLEGDARPTFERSRLDYIFADQALAPWVSAVHVGERRVSDHLPIWVDVHLPGPWPSP